MGFINQFIAFWGYHLARFKQAVEANLEIDDETLERRD